MKKDIAEKWVAALRSGDYKQGILNLRNHKDEFCCLGVLCEIMGVEKEFSGNRYLYDGCGAGIMSSVRILTGIKSDLGYLYTPKYSSDSCLASMNDQGKTFSEIADIIEEEWENL